MILIKGSWFVVRTADLDPTSLADHQHFTRLQRRRGAMNSEMKILLDELEKRFAAQNERFNNLDWKIDATANSSTHLKALEHAAQVFDEWHPGIEGIMDDLKIEVGKLLTLKMEVGKISKY